MQQLVGDFETTTNPLDVRVWASCLVDIDSLKVIDIWNNIEETFEWFSKRNTKVFYHNLKFDGEFILSYLLRSNFVHDNSHEANTFETLITDDGQFYSITVYFKKLKGRYLKVIIHDSYKKLPMKAKIVAESFKLKESKGVIDYRKDRPRGYEPTQDEREYITDDCMIIAQALHMQFEKGLDKMTIGSDALNGYKKVISKDRFLEWFPVLPFEMDKDIRRAYKGGWTYLYKKNVKGVIPEGITLDVNSLYPWAMYYCNLPYGYPRYFEDEYEPNEKYSLYIQHFWCEFKLKKDKLPMIQLKGNSRFVQTEYLSSSKGEIVELWLTSVDMKLFKENYDILCVEYVNGWMFKSCNGVFCKYIDYWMNVKSTTSGGEKQIAKLMLNSLYGKFATNPKSVKKIPVLVDDIVMYDLEEPEFRDPVYTAMGCFITAWARDKEIRTAQSEIGRFLYGDTDSLHLSGYELPKNIDIHESRLGAFKLEESWTDGKFLRAKTYMETYDNGDGSGVRPHITCAGMPDNVKNLVNYDNFDFGESFEGKLTPKRYPGGIILVDRDFTIKKG